MFPPRGAAAFLLSILATAASGQTVAKEFFDDTKVQEIRIYFDDPNWYNKLYQAHASDPADPYFPARIRYGDLVLDNVGVRFKGNASFRRNGIKKSFKIDFNEFVDDLKFLGLKKLNLNNGDLQPDFLREKLFLDNAARYIPAMRAVHTRVYVNDAYYGLYIAVEQPDKTMMQDRFGANQDGNLYEAGEANVFMTYLGPDKARYKTLYELKTNEEEDDYSGLINFLDILNNTPVADLPAKLEPVCDVDNMLYGIAMNILTVNLDSYAGSGSEFYLYQRSDTGQFVHIHWDLNESFGTTGDGSPRIADPPRLSLFWLPTGTQMGPGGPSSNSRPLMEKLWAVEEYRRRYLRMVARMLREWFNPEAMKPRIGELAGLIRESVYEDRNKAYTNAQFETSLVSNITGGQTIQGLMQFVTTRYNYLRPILDGYALPTDVRLNEVMPLNGGVAADDAGDADPWVEIYNLGPGPLELSRFSLTDDPEQPGKWMLPEGKLADGAYRVLWLDGQPEQGAGHALFRLEAGGGKLYFYDHSKGTPALIDTVEYPGMEAGRSFMRAGERGTGWQETNRPTPGAGNLPGVPELEAVQVYINEFMADNKTTLENPGDPGAYDDWVELYNAGAEDVHLGGMYLTDNLNNPVKWRIPDGVVIPAGGYLVFYADEKMPLGPLHAAFKLSASGEEIGLFHRDGKTLIDSIVFGRQQTDVSYARTPDASANWNAVRTPTPGSANPGMP